MRQNEYCDVIFKRIEVKVNYKNVYEKQNNT